MNRHRQGFDEAGVAGRDARRQRDEGSFWHQNFFCHSPIAADSEDHRKPFPAALVVTRGTAIASPTGCERFNGHWFSVGKESRDLVTEGVGWSKGTVHNVKIGTADPRGADTHANAFSCRPGNLHNIDLAFVAANGLHGVASFRRDIRGKVPDVEPSPG